MGATLAVAAGRRWYGFVELFEDKFSISSISVTAFKGLFFSRKVGFVFYCL